MRSYDEAYGYALRSPGEPLERIALDDLEPAAGQVLVQVAGCGVCHTDIGFAVDGVPTRHPLPLILGHEISGRVVAAGDGADGWVGRAVVVPAVVPCGGCAACLAGRPGVCRQQFMPGNHGHGGFATHVRVPSTGLCPVPEDLPRGVTLEMLAVVADAVTTPFEAIRRSALTADDVAVFVGVGGVGGFGVQIAAALGAAVVAVDVDPERLRRIAGHGASRVLDARELEVRELRSAVRELAEASGRQGIGLKVFETSGTAAGQRTAFGLLDPGGHLAIVGYVAEPVEVHLSKLMAFDATAAGNWGSAPGCYPDALELVLTGRVALAPFVETHPLDEAPAVLRAVADRQIRKRAILVPPGDGAVAWEAR